jgi:hypothetical protein
MTAILDGILAHPVGAVGLALGPFSNRLTSHFIRSSARCSFFFVHASTREKTFHLLRIIKFDVVVWIGL